MAWVKSLIRLLQMGGKESKEKQQDHYFLYDLSKMSLQNTKTVSYYLISPKNSQQIAALSNNLRKYFKIQNVSSIKALKEQTHFVSKLELVKIIVTSIITQQDLAYLEQQPKFSQIVIYGGIMEGIKIAGCANTTEQLINLLNALQESDKLQLPATTVLFLIDEDIKKMNNYRLNYHSIVACTDRSSAKKDFIELARTLMPEQHAQIDQFEKHYNLQLNGEQRRKMVFDWAFKDSFYWQILSGLSRNTTDPKRLAYLRLVIKDLHESINEQHQINKFSQNIYIVVELNQEEKRKLDSFEHRNNINNKQIFIAMLFSSFMKGTTSERDSIRMLKQNPNNYRFLIQFSRRSRVETYEFGYVKIGDQVIVNIHNLFQVTYLRNKSRRFQLLDGILPITLKRRQELQGSFHYKMSRYQLNLLKNYDYLQQLVSQIDGQGPVLQFNGYFNECLQIYEKKFDFAKKCQEPNQNVSRYSIKKADALTLNGDYEAVEKVYLSAAKDSQQIRATYLVHLIQLYIRLGEEEKIDLSLDQLQKILSILQKDQKTKEQFFKGSHFLAQRMLKNGKASLAEIMLQNIMKIISRTYGEVFERKTIFHDVLRSFAVSKSKQGKHFQALKLLEEIRCLQLLCEGKSHNVWLTEGLIQWVSRRASDEEELKKSQTRMEQLFMEIETYERRLQSSAMVYLSLILAKMTD